MIFKQLVFKQLVFNVLLGACAHATATNNRLMHFLKNFLSRASVTVDRRLWTVDKSAPRTFSETGLKETVLNNRLNTIDH